MWSNLKKSNFPIFPYMFLHFSYIFPYVPTISYISICFQMFFIKKIFNKNKDNNLLRYNLAVIQQNLNLNEEARINYNHLIKS